MAANNPLPPDLASLLSTLSRYAPHQATPAPPLLQVPAHQVPAPPADWLPSGPVQAIQTPLQPSTNVIDPATITEWSAGLRCVTKIAAGDPRFGDTIKKMIHNQRQNEADWYSRRQQLKKDQSQRGHGSNELLDIMKSIGAASITPSPVAKEANDQAELNDFDQKILRAQKQMNAALTAELKALGVPFFGTAADLVADDKQMFDGAARSISGPKWSQAITHQELLDLQRRMISYLEDMYRE